MFFVLSFCGGKEEKFIDEGWGIAYDFFQFCPAGMK
jgi:hypothetical protein